MEENDKEIFRDYVKDNAEMIVNWQIKTGEPASEAIARVYKDMFGQNMPQELAEDLKLEELDRKAEKIAKSVGVECGYDKERVKREIEADPVLAKAASAPNPSQLPAAGLTSAEIKNRMNNIMKDDKSPQIHNFYQLLMAVAVNVFRQLGQLSQQNQQQEQALAPKEQTQQMPTSEEQTEMRARRHDINAQMESALRSAPATASAAYDDMAQAQQEQQSNGMSLGR